MTLATNTCARTLWLPLHAPKSAWVCTAFLFAYLLSTMARDLSYFDSPELAMVAVEGGLSHPPGQVLHTLLGVLATRVVPLSPLVTLNALSALFGALSLLPVLSLAGTALDSARPGGALPRSSHALATFALLHAALWEQASRVEVYSLSTFIGLWTLAVAAHGFRLRTGSDAENRTHALRVGLGLGLTASANPVFALMTASALLPLLFRPALVKTALHWVVLGGVAGLLPYAYIALVARREDAFVWGDPTSWDNVLRYVSSADFQQNLRGTALSWAEHALDLVTRPSYRTLTPLLVFGAAVCTWLPLGALGRGTALTLTIVSIAYITRNAVWNPDIPDFVSYFAIPLHVGIAATVSLALLLRERGLRIGSFALSAALCVLPVVAEPSLLLRGRGSDRSARSIASAALKSLPPRTLAIVSTDHLAWPMLYLQRVEGLRPDVVIFPRGLASSSWYWDLTYRDHPMLKPFAIRGAGGATGRLQRFLSAQAGTPIAAERLETLAELGLPACVGPWLVHSLGACPTKQSSSEAAVALARFRDDSSGRDPSTLGAVSAVAFTLGETAYRLGDAHSALLLFTAALPQNERLLASQVPLRALSLVPHFQAPPLQWQRATPLGDPARNAFMASHVVHAAGFAELAQRWLRFASELGLPEARVALEGAGR